MGGFYDLGIAALLAGDAAEESLAREGAVAHYNESGISDLADSLGLEREGLADELQGLASLREEGARRGSGA